MTAFTTLLFLIALFVLRFGIPFVVTITFCYLVEQFRGNGGDVAKDGYVTQ